MAWPNDFDAAVCAVPPMTPASYGTAVSWADQSDGRSEPYSSSRVKVCTPSQAVLAWSSSRERILTHAKLLN